MKTFDKSIKIKIEGHSYTKEDLKGVSRWEDEGGHTFPFDGDPAYQVTLPVHKGEIFEVMEGQVIYENDELYYLASINILSTS